MSVLKNLGFGNRGGSSAPPQWGVRGVDDYGGTLKPEWTYSEPDEFGSYESSAAMPGASSTGGGGLMDDPEDIKQKIADWLKKKGKGQGKGDGQGQGLLDVYQGMRPVSPFSIIGRPNLQGR